MNKKSGITEKITKRIGVIVYLDAVGTKTIWTREDPARYMKSWQRIIKSLYIEKKDIEITFKEMKKDLRDLYLIPQPTIMSFSDTIILSLSHPIHEIEKRRYNWDEEILTSIGQILQKPLYKAIMEEGIYLRGVISYGEFYISNSNSFIIGHAVNEAAAWYEEPEWFGISTTPSASYVLQNIKNSYNYSNYLIQYPIPIKNNDKPLNSYAIIWPDFFQIAAKAVSDEDRQPGLHCSIINRKMQEIYEKSKGKLLESFSSNRVIDGLSYQKYDNTVKFFDYVFKETKKENSPYIQ